MRRPLALGAALVLAATIVACGGDGDGIRISATTGTGTGTPTATAAGEATASATPTPLPVPALPENAFAGGRIVEEYLVGGAPDLEGCLPELVDRWGMASEVDGERCALLDLDGDRKDEFVFLVSYASGADDESPYPADLWFFEDEDEGFRFHNSARALANASTAALRIRSLDDLTSDGLPEVTMTWDECGAHTCVTHVSVASYHNGFLENLAPAEASIESIEEFTMEAGVISLRGGLIGSVGAGPQRESTTVVRWAGARFRVETVEGPPAYLVHLVNDADALYAIGEYADAKQAYLDAAGNNALPDWRAEIGEAPGRPELQAYATFRAALSAFRLNDLLGAGSLLERAATQYPQTMHGSAAIEYLIALQGGATPEDACSAAENFLDAMREQYVAFWNYGYANPERNVFGLCR
ncbi:MAG: tol-pal system YbgF family protein [Dehalococcoidia bacterium]